MAVSITKGSLTTLAIELAHWAGACGLPQMTEAYKFEGLVKSSHSNGAMNTLPSFTDGARISPLPRCFEFKTYTEMIFRVFCRVQLTV